jgi:hypothetical protein
MNNPRKLHFYSCSSLPYNSRTARKRRAVVNSTDTSKDVNPERLSMYRAIEVFLPKDEDNLPIGKPTRLYCICLPC